MTPCFSWKNTVTPLLIFLMVPPPQENIVVMFKHIIMYFKEKLEHTDATNKFVSDQEFRHSIFGYGIIFFFLLLFVLNDIGINMSLFLYLGQNWVLSTSFIWLWSFLYEDLVCTFI